MSRLNIVVFFFAIITLLSSWTEAVLHKPDVPFFRRDYTYHTEAAGWLKVHLMPLQWTKARTKCLNEGAVLTGAVLASPLNEGLYTVMQMHLLLTDRYFFIGMQIFTELDDYHSIEGVRLEDMPVKWAPGEPDNKENGEFCLAIGGGGTLSDVPCDRRLPYMCYKKNTGVVALNESGTPDLILHKPDAPFFRRDYTYHTEADGWLKVHLMPLQWTKAQTKCLNEGAVLASPLNEGLYTVMQMHLLLTDRYFFTGMQIFTELDDYISVEGVRLEDMPVKWAPGEPDNKENGELCLAIGGGGTLSDVPCDRRLPYMCYKKNTGVVALNECGTPDLNYKLEKSTGSCYKLSTMATTWKIAQSMCSSEGGHLAIINSETEAGVIQTLTANCGSCGYVFVGFYKWVDVPGTSYWTTVDGKTLEEAGFNRWTPGEPNNRNGKESCGSYTIGSISYNDYSCDDDSFRFFICEIEKPRAN